MIEPASSPAYDRLLQILEKYVSRIMARSMLMSATAQLKISPAQFGPPNATSLVEELMKGLRLFCNPERLPSLMVELAEFCDHVESTTTHRKSSIRTPQR